MHDHEGQAKLGYRGSVTSRPKGLLAKTLGVVLGGAVLVSAFVVSIAFFVVAAVLVIVGGGYLWWKTRDLRRQMREQFEGGSGMQEWAMQESRRADERGNMSAGNVNEGDVIEGVVISRKEASEHPR